VSNIIDKIQKLRALAARAGSVHEAEAAAAAADKLVQENGIEEAQLEVQGQLAAEAPIEDVEPVAKWVGRTPTWQLLLVCDLMHHYDCVGYRTWIYSDGRNVGEMVPIVGRPSDIANVRFMYGWLVVEIERLAQAANVEGNGRSWLDSFRRGAAAGVRDKLHESKKAVVQAATARAKVAEEILHAVNPAAPITSATAALALYDKRKDEAKAKLYALHPGLEKQEKRSRGGSSVRGAGDYSAFHEGHQAGRNIHTGAVLNAGSGDSARALKSGK
jgi:hypothetical protein